MDFPNLPKSVQQELNRVVAGLRGKLDDNLYSLILYGSTVRGAFDQRSSDINLLIILNQSTPHAHHEIAGLLKSKIRIEPFVISKIGMERSFEAFAIKFLSIQRSSQIF